MTTGEGKKGSEQDRMRSGPGAQKAGPRDPLGGRSACAHGPSFGAQVAPVKSSVWFFESKSATDILHKKVSFPKSEF